MCQNPSRWLFFAAILALAPCLSGGAQTPDSLPPAAAPAVVEEEEDYSQYENVQFADAGARRFCSPKIFDLSPQRFVSVAWDAQLGHRIGASPLGSFEGDERAPEIESGRVRYAGGLRLGANIPVVSRQNIVWQASANFWDIRYRIAEERVNSETPNYAGFLLALEDRGLLTSGLTNTVFKPLNEHSFLILQVGADLSGDYTLADFQPLRFLRYSASAIWGRRPHDRKQWGIGVSRTYRVGELNYVPVVMFNYTAPNRKWGTEILFPARAHFRRTFTPRSLLLAGYELEGQSYRLSEISETGRSLELRRGELRARLEYQRQLTGFIWLSAQVGWRYDWSFRADDLDGGERDIFRGFFGDQRYAMLNALGNPLFFNLGVHLVSP